MIIPNFQECMLPCLQFLNQNGGQPKTLKQCVSFICVMFNLTAKQMKVQVPGKSCTIVRNRTQWAITYLKHAGLIASVVRGTYKITNEGEKLLASGPKEITTNLLQTKYPSFAKFLNKNVANKPVLDKFFLQNNIIYYGAPGTGKSFGIKDEINSGKIPEDNIIRITFHPDTNYASFVGCYKPMQDPKNENNIIYSYMPEPFIEAYTKSWERNVGKDFKDKKFFLIIEELNRGNCAQIFGDIFQLLDRDNNGYSSYKITPDKDLQIYLKKEFKDGKYKDMPQDLRSGIHMQLPDNFHIIATMNTSDQSLFPMDGAFKRRWYWRYVKIDTRQVPDTYFMVGSSKYRWGVFVDNINSYIKEINHSTAKQIGPWFVKAELKEKADDEQPTIISYNTFCSKVLFYLFNDALKDEPDFGEKFKSEKEEDSDFLFENLFDSNDEGVDYVNNFLKSNIFDENIKVK